MVNRERSVIFTVPRLLIWFIGIGVTLTVFLISVAVLVQSREVEHLHSFQQCVVAVNSTTDSLNNRIIAATVRAALARQEGNNELAQQEVDRITSLLREQQTASERQDRASKEC